MEVGSKNKMYLIANGVKNQSTLQKCVNSTEMSMNRINIIKASFGTCSAFENLGANLDTFFVAKLLLFSAKSTRQAVFIVGRHCQTKKVF